MRRYNTKSSDEGADACSKDECVGTDDYRALSVWVLGTDAIWMKCRCGSKHRREKSQQEVKFTFYVYV